jgi:hypothetical protein
MPVQTRFGDLAICAEGNTTTASISIFGIHAFNRTQTSASEAIRLASTQKQRPLLLRHRGPDGRHGQAQFASTLHASAPSFTTYCTVLNVLEAYISVFTRPDISLTHSILSRFLTSPGEQHLRAAIHAWRFLIRTRNLALKASAFTPDNT